MTATTPTVPETANVTRTFIYNDNRLPDPGAQYSNEEIRCHLAAAYFPELAQCEVKPGTVKDGVQEIRFVKRVTTKGREADAAGRLPAGTFDDPHHATLQTLPCEQNPAPAIEDATAYFGTDAPTIATVLSEEHDTWIADFLDAVWDAAHGMTEADGRRTQRWLPALPPQPLTQLPIGF